MDSGAELTSYVYIIQNKITGDVYVGKANNPEARWRRHCTYRNNKKHLYRAFEKYRVDAFEFSVVESWPSEIETYDAEQWMISYLRSMGVTLYNENNGGHGQSRGKTWTLSEKTRQKQREAQKKKLPPTKEQKEAISKALKGRSLSEGHRKNIGKSGKGINKGRIHSEKSRQNMRNGHLGTTLAEEHRKNISEGNRRRWKRWREEQNKENADDVNA